MIHDTDLPPIQSELQSSDYYYTLVHMAGDNLSGADIHTPKDQTTRRLGISRHSSKMQDTFIKSNVGTKQQGGDSDSSMA